MIKLIWKDGYILKDTEDVQHETNKILRGNILWIISDRLRVCRNIVNPSKRIRQTRRFDYIGRNRYRIICLYCALGLTLGESALYILFNNWILLLEQIIFLSFFFWKLTHVLYCLIKIDILLNLLRVLILFQKASIELWFIFYFL